MAKRKRGPPSDLEEFLSDDESASSWSSAAFTAEESESSYEVSSSGDVFDPKDSDADVADDLADLGIKAPARHAGSKKTKRKHKHSGKQKRGAKDKSPDGGNEQQSNSRFLPDPFEFDSDSEYDDDDAPGLSPAKAAKHPTKCSAGGAGRRGGNVMSWLRGRESDDEIPIVEPKAGGKVKKEKGTMNQEKDFIKKEGDAMEKRDSIKKERESTRKKGVFSKQQSDPNGMKGHVQGKKQDAKRKIEKATTRGEESVEDENESTRGITFADDDTEPSDDAGMDRVIGLSLRRQRRKHREMLARSRRRLFGAPPHPGERKANKAALPSSAAKRRDGERKKHGLFEGWPIERSNKYKSLLDTTADTAMHTDEDSSDIEPIPGMDSTVNQEEAHEQLAHRLIALVSQHKLSVAATDELASLLDQANTIAPPSALDSTSAAADATSDNSKRGFGKQKVTRDTLSQRMLDSRTSSGPSFVNLSPASRQNTRCSKSNLAKARPPGKLPKTTPMKSMSTNSSATLDFLMHKTQLALERTLRSNLGPLEKTEREIVQDIVDGGFAVEKFVVLLERLPDSVRARALES
ncbi:MAG: hypothetical protein Q9162_006672 [Coniocarpon cinnabarinum]